MNDRLTRLDRFELSSPGVVFETIDGESVVLNLETGIYYSAAGAGADVLEGVAAGAALGDVVDRVLAAYDGDADMESAIWSFLREIVAEGLVRADSAGSTAPMTWQPAWGGRTTDRRVSMQRYTDMAHLLLLDPIHDVDEIQVSAALPADA